jgi:S1-C subfamily serine protease
MNTNSYSWQCPSCARQVPRKISACRCGFERPADAPEPAAVEVESSPEPAATGPNRLLLGLFFGLAIAAGMLWYLKEEPLPQQQVTLVLPAPTGPPEPPPVDDPQSPFPEPALNLPADNSFTAGDLPDPESPTSNALEDVVARAVPAVASIQAGRGRGTGFFVQRDIVLTNHHVVGAETSVQLIVSGKKYQARVTNTSPGTDLAVLQVYGADPTQATLRLGTAKAIRPGQEVVAIGSALGVLSNTVTRGIVSAIRDTGSVTLVQTDAAINPGNSGGPLVDRNGVVIGVNSMKIGGATGEGLAFAVAIDHASQLLSGRTPTPAAATPLQGLNRMMNGATASEDLRDEGTNAYRTAVERASRRADQLDDVWEDAAKSCVVRAVRAGDRAWFAVYETNGLHIQLSNGVDCQYWLSTLQTNAALIRTDMTRAVEAARRQGVYPGVARDIRRQFKMEGPGW